MSDAWEIDRAIGNARGTHPLQRFAHAIGEAQSTLASDMRASAHMQHFDATAEQIDLQIESLQTVAKLLRECAAEIDTASQNLTLQRGRGQFKTQAQLRRQAYQYIRDQEAKE